MTTTIPQQGTKDRILDAAQQLFAEHGFADTSLRMITAEACVNLAAVNYHFGSKEALIGSVFARLVEPVNRERLARLDRIESEAGKRRLPLDEVVGAFIEPALLMWKTAGETAIRLVGRTYAESNEHMLRIFKEQFTEVIHRFAQALMRALPDLDRTEVLWRLQFAVGAMAHTMVAHDQLKTVFGEMHDPAQSADLIERLTAFIVGGMRAPLAKTRKAGRGGR
jgi:AcrR family transcriptional regulator